MLRFSHAVLVIAAMALGCTPRPLASPANGAEPGGPSTTPPNIVVLLADDLGIGEVGAWGQREVATPNIDRLAAEGMRFTEFRSSAAVCGPARCSFMTGYHNGRCRLDDNDNDYLRDADVTLAERLRASGYATALVGKWGLSWDSQPESWPQAQGFDVFFGYRDQVHAHNFFPEYLLDGTDSLRTRNVVPNPRGMGSGSASVRLDYAPDLLRARAFRFVREQATARKPFFLFWATNLPHIHNETARTAPDGGYETTSLGPYADRSWSLPKRSYAAQIHRLDEDLGALRALLDTLGAAQNTVVIFLSDNGATFLRGPHDGTSEIIGRWFNGTMAYRGFKGDLYDGGLRVPGIVHWPGVVQSGRTTAARVDFTDLHATLVEIGGARAPMEITGRSFLPLLTGKGAYRPRDVQVWYSPDRRQSAVLTGRWKAVWMLDTLRLFDLERDPGETTDVAAGEPGVVTRLDSIRRAEDRRVQHPRLPAAPATLPATARGEVLVLTTGGTIASRTTGPMTDGASLVRGIPELAKVANVRVDEVFRIPSSQMTPSDWLRLAKRINAELAAAPRLRGVVVTHGTDTMEETAFFLNLTVRDPRPVVVIGSMRGGDEVSADGPANLLNGVRVAVSDGAKGQGVLVVLNENIGAARDVWKTDNRRVDTFRSPERGYLGTADPDTVMFFRRTVERHTTASEFDVSRIEVLPTVEIVTDYAGFDSTIMRAAIQRKPQGLVLTSFAGGRLSAGAQAAVRMAGDVGIPLVVASRVPGGRIVGTPHGNLPRILARDLSAQKARVLLMLALTRTTDRAALQQIFDRY